MLTRALHEAGGLMIGRRIYQSRRVAYPFPALLGERRVLPGL